MKTLKDLKEMVNEPSSKEWFKKHGLPGKKKDIAKKMSGFSTKNNRPMLSHEQHKKHKESIGKDSFHSEGYNEWEKKKNALSGSLAPKKSPIVKKGLNK